MVLDEAFYRTGTDPVCHACPVVWCNQSGRRPQAQGFMGILMRTEMSNPVRAGLECVGAGDGEGIVPRECRANRREHGGHHAVGGDVPADFGLGHEVVIPEVRTEAHVDTVRNQVRRTRWAGARNCACGVALTLRARTTPRRLLFTGGPRSVSEGRWLAAPVAPSKITPWKDVPRSRDPSVRCGDRNRVSLVIDIPGFFVLPWITIPNLGFAQPLFRALATAPGLDRALQHNARNHRDPRQPIHCCEQFRGQMNCGAHVDTRFQGNSHDTLRILSPVSTLPALITFALIPRRHSFFPRREFTNLIASSPNRATNFLQPR